MLNIHRYWTGDAPTPLGPWGCSVLANSQRAQVLDWTDATLPTHIYDAAEAGRGRVHHADAARHRANIVRLALLAEFGGWWADHDLIPLVDFSTLPFPATAEHRGGMRCNCWLAFPPAHPALIETLARAMTAPVDPHGESRSVSGERLLNSVCSDEVARVRLLIDVDGRFNDAAQPWAVHAHATASRRRVAPLAL